VIAHHLFSCVGSHVTVPARQEPIVAQAASFCADRVGRVARASLRKHVPDPAELDALQVTEQQRRQRWWRASGNDRPGT